MLADVLPKEAETAAPPAGEPVAHSAESFFTNKGAKHT